MDFKELIEKRHSVRSYKTTSIPEDILNCLVASVELAPTSRNKKPCKTYLVTDKSLLEKLSCAKAAGSQMAKDAAAVIVVAGDSEKSDVWIEDCSIAMTYLHLEAVNLGLGSVWVQLRNRKNAEGKDSAQVVKDLLGLEDKMQVLAMLCVGNIC